MPTFDFSITPKPAVNAQTPAEQVTRPAAPPAPPSRDAGADMKTGALSGGGSSGSGVAQAESVDANQISRPANSAPRSQTSSSRGRRGKSDSDALSVVKIPASLASYAREQMGGLVTRSEAVAAYLYMIFAQGDTPPEVPGDIAALAEKVPVAPNSDIDLHRELSQMQSELGRVMNLLRVTNKALLDTQSAVIWLLGERLGSPGANAELGAQRLNIAFSDAELLRHRLTTQTSEREVELQTKRGRAIEDDKFRKAQREGSK